MSDEEVAQNIEAVVNALTRELKRGMGNIKNIYLKLTMGDSIKLY
jgi:ribosomal protein L1